MSIFLGNLQFSEIEEKLGFRLTDEDKVLWDKYHNNKADLSGMDECFHVFDIPRSIQVKGESAKQALLIMFNKSKMIEAKGKIHVYEKT